MAQSPCFFAPLANSLFASFFTLLDLLGNPPCCDRIPSTLVPGYSWTDLPFLNPSPFPPHSKFPAPRLIVRLTTTTSWSRLLMSGTNPINVHVHVQVWLQVQVRVRVWVCVQAWVCVQVWVRVRVWVCVRIWVSVCVQVQVRGHVWIRVRVLIPTNTCTFIPRFLHNHYMYSAFFYMYCTCSYKYVLMPCTSSRLSTCSCLHACSCPSTCSPPFSCASPPTVHVHVHVHINAHEHIYMHIHVQVQIIIKKYHFRTLQ